MLTREMNDRLTRVGPGTPMGDLLRRYWIPIGAASEVDDLPIRRRILGEDLVLFRDGSGAFGLVQERCPHRNTSLAYGMVEEHGIRCSYHGWLFDQCGNCLEQPAEPEQSTFKTKVRAVAYEVQQLGGLLFAYLGPQPAPLVPRYDLFVDDERWRDIGHAVIPCNWLQIMENTMDPHHVEWLHGHYMNHLAQRTGARQTTIWTKRHVRVGFDTFKYGLLKRRVLEGNTEEDDDWKIGHPLVFPFLLRVGSGGFSQFQIRVPADDETTLHIWYNSYLPDPEMGLPKQVEIPHYEVPYLAEDGSFMTTDYVDGQDIMAWCSPGVILDRTKENICSSDRGIVLLRRTLQEQLQRVENGEDPMGVVRDPVENVRIELPQEHDKAGESRGSRTDFLLMGSTKYSPILDQIMSFFENADAKVGQ